MRDKIILVVIGLACLLLSGLAVEAGLWGELAALWVAVGYLVWWVKPDDKIDT